MKSLGGPAQSLLLASADSFNTLLEDQFFAPFAIFCPTSSLPSEPPRFLFSGFQTTGVSTRRFLKTDPPASFSSSVLFPSSGGWRC